MILYRFGEIVHKNNNNLILESYGTGYSIMVPNHERFEAKTKIKLFLIEINNEYQKNTYGFKEFKERLLFQDLISINGIGPKLAFNILDNDWEKIVDWIINENMENLTRISYLSLKTAKLIIFELKNKWSKMMNKNINTSNNNNEQKEQINTIKDTLKMLGFKNEQIQNAINNIEFDKDIETNIDQAIRYISKEYEKPNIKA
ncbi:Holliday junction branch migration protein RuvA [Mycoplasmopsis gallinarum]